MAIVELDAWRGKHDTQDALAAQLRAESLTQLEARIERGLGTFVEVGLALLEIRDRRLYREAGFGTFEEYCRQRWGFHRSRLYQLMDAATVAGTLSTIVDKLPLPANEAQARELAPLVRRDPAAAAQVWQELQQRHAPEEITAARIREAVQERLRPTPEPEPMPMAQPAQEAPSQADMPPPQAVAAIDALAEHAVREYQAGQTVGLREMAGQAIPDAGHGEVHYCKYCYENRPTAISDDGSVIICSVCGHGLAPVSEVLKDGSYADFRKRLEEEWQASAPTTTATAKLIVQSNSNEWYTPARYIEAARLVLGEIDLDPASCTEANKTVQAKRYFTQEDDGLQHDWPGRVWLNPPYGGLTAKFVRKLIGQYRAGITKAAILLVNAHATDTDWFQPLWDYILCFTDHRINFISPNGDAASGSTHGSVFVYLGPDRQRFAEVFSQFGAVVVRYRP